jgi:hypothetical protein
MRSKPERPRRDEALTICLFPPPHHRHRDPLQPTHSRPVSASQGWMYHDLSKTCPHLGHSDSNGQPSGRKENTPTLVSLSSVSSCSPQIIHVRVIHETSVSTFVGIFVGLVVRLAPGNMIRRYWYVSRLRVCSVRLISPTPGVQAQLQSALPPGPQPTP